MPEKVNHSAFEKCNSCASNSDGPGLGRLSTVSHPQVCCLFMVTKQEQFSELLHDEWSPQRHDGLFSDLFLDEGSHKRHDGLCDEQFSDLFLGEGSHKRHDGLCDELFSDLILDEGSRKRRDGVCEELFSDLILHEGSPKRHDGLCQEQFSHLLHDEGSRKRRDGLCEDCPNVEFHVDPVYGQPPTREYASPEGCEAAPGVRGSPTKKRKIIEPRMREGFKKLTLEWRPPRFKRKIWFGTYSYDEIHRARDAVTYYLQLGDPYFLPDSRRIYAERPLTGIEFQDLLPSCDQYVDEALVRSNLMGITCRDFLPPGHHAAKKLAACVVYGRQVKKVIHTVLGKHKKSADKKIHKDNNVQKLDIYDAVEPLPSFSEEYDEEHAALFKFTTQTPHYQWGYAGPPFPLDEMFSLPMVPTPSYGESSTMDEDGYSATLWEPFSYG